MRAYSEAFRSRLADIATKTTELTRRKEAAITEYREAFADLADDEPTKARRDQAKAALDAIIAEQDRARQADRPIQHLPEGDGAGLAGARVIVNTLEWESGYPLDSMSLLSERWNSWRAARSRVIVRRPGDPAAAPQAADRLGAGRERSGPAVWGGPFLDANRNGTMEFAPPDQPLPPANWSPEMNFLGVQSPTGRDDRGPPRRGEAAIHDAVARTARPELPAVDQPMHPVVLRLFRQLDPNGEKRPSDEMAEDARSVGGPYPILLTKTFVVYEQILEFTVPVAGRYALVVATGYQPEPLLPALKREVEINPRMIVETLSAKPGERRVVFRSYVTPEAGVGIPGDSTGVDHRRRAGTRAN